MEREDIIKLFKEKGLQAVWKEAQKEVEQRIKSSIKEILILKQEAQRFRDESFESSYRRGFWEGTMNGYSLALDEIEKHTIK